MDSTESMESRAARVAMHQFFADRIDAAIQKQRYIEATWLIYSCLEERYSRTQYKYKVYCEYCRKGSRCNKEPENQLALTSRIKCVLRLLQNNEECIANSFSEKLLQDTLKWVEKRNKLMHHLVSPEHYQEIDEEFKRVADQGYSILKDTYSCCTEFRELFYVKGYEFRMPEKAMKACSCKPRKGQGE